MPVSMLQKVRQNAKKDILVLPTKSVTESVTGGLWTPSVIATQLWLDATDSSTITQSGGLVSQWNDKSGKSRHLTQPNAALQPTYTGNGIDFFLNKGLAVIASNIEVRFVIVITKSQNPIWVNFHAHLDSPAKPRIGGLRRGSETGFHNDAFPLAVWEDGVSKVPSFSGFNSIDSPHIIGYNTAIVIPLLGFSVGNFDMGSSGGAGVEYETIALDTVPSEALRQQLEGYLAWKHTALGLVANLASDHPYKSAAPRL